MFLERFFNYLQYEKRYSQHTLTAYKNDLLQFENFLTEFESDFLTVNHQQIRTWMITLLDDGIEARSVNRKISTLRAFYKFLVKEEILAINPVLKVQAPKVAKKLPAFVEEAKLITLLDSASVFESGFVGVRDKLILELLFGTGIRLSELLGLTISAIDLNSQTIKVLGKRNKERIVPINHSLVNQIKDYLRERLVVITDTNMTSFIVTEKGEQAYAKLIYRIVHRYLSLVTTQDKKSPHLLRHSYATSLLNHGADINAIKELLGHASLAATQVYTHNSIERIKTIYKQAHPKA
ncbi:tyrosine-type recombinase/integrase [Pedobacter aquae]|uniref:Tyrosine recombinase XerC n=1 Tax=Pedobacter aquae TaxID=2605747 RepID=A0A5C0VCH9_9SPHI|nr:tyrosine-type recombinase/integrase [Pedobacter aquae]QEK50478.1 tyrosine-type recombinase/integrase [Pedobacter aquae]